MDPTPQTFAGSVSIWWRQFFAVSYRLHTCLDMIDPIPLPEDAWSHACAQVFMSHAKRLCLDDCREVFYLDDLLSAPGLRQCALSLLVVEAFRVFRSHACHEEPISNTTHLLAAGRACSSTCSCHVMRTGQSFSNSCKQGTAPAN